MTIALPKPQGSARRLPVYQPASQYLASRQMLAARLALAAKQAAKRKKKPARGWSSYFRRGDARQMTGMIAGCVAIVAAALFSVDYLHTSYRISAAAKAELAAQAEQAAMLRAQQKALALRTGSIVFATNGSCEELRFNNYTGAFVSIDPVDCIARLTESLAASNDFVEKKSSNMRAVMASFGQR